MIELSPWALKAYEDGFAQMERSKDPTHDSWHVEELFGFLDQFLEEDSVIDKFQINFDILIVGITWHDVWKSRKKQNFNPLTWVYQMYYERIGAEKIFLKYAESEDLPQKESKEIAYSIRHHPSLKIKKKNRVVEANVEEIDEHLESSLLRDFDLLGVWNIEKYERLINIFCHEDMTLKRPFMRHVIKWHYNTFFRDKSDHFFTDWARAEFVKRRNDLLEFSKKFMEVNRIEVKAR